MKFEESGIIKRFAGNPILSKKNIPYPAELIFNAGITKYNGRYVMCFRNDYGVNEEQYRGGDYGLRTNIGFAESIDGIRWKVKDRPVFEFAQAGFSRAYDPRLTVIDGRCYLCFAVDGEAGVSGGIAVTDDFDRFDVLYLSEPDNRNMVLFPEKIGPGTGTGGGSGRQVPSEAPRKQPP